MRFHRSAMRGSHLEKLLGWALLSVWRFRTSRAVFLLLLRRALHFVVFWRMSETRKSAEAVFVPLRLFSPRCEGFALRIQTPHCGFKRQRENSQCVLLHRRKETAKRRPFCARRGFKREGFDEASRDVAKQPQVPVGLSRFFADQGSQTEEKDQEAQSVQLAERVAAQLAV